MEDNKLVVKRVFNAPIEKVWDAWTDPKSLMQWKSPEGLTTPHAEADLRVGGTYKVTMEGDHPRKGYIKITVSGQYKTIEKPTTLAFTWKWEGTDEDTLVTLNFKKVDDSKTAVTLTHEGFKTTESKVEHGMGWESTLNKLSTFLKA